MSKARRYNNGKLRYDLISRIALEELAKVYTKGAHKYSIYKDKDGNEVKGITNFEGLELVDDGANNWRKGLSWSDTASAVMRHVEKFLQGEDIDELGTYHLANAAWGLFTLLDFYKTYPEGDDRNHWYKNQKRIGLDIDDVVADFSTHFLNWFGIDDIPNTYARFWQDPFIKSKFAEIANNEEFWMTIPAKINPSTELPFEPCCFITSRSIDKEITKKWLHKNGFPDVDVYSVGVNKSKLEAAKEAKIDIFVDDRFDTFVELNKNNICTFLMDASHNKRYDVGYKRIYSLKQLVNI